MPLVWLEPDFWTFRQKKSRISAFKSFEDYPFPGKVANLKYFSAKDTYLLRHNDAKGHTGYLSKGQPC